MWCNRSKPGACCHLSFAINPVLSNVIGKIKFFIQLDILVLNYSEGGHFLNKLNKLNYCRMILK